MLHLFLHTRRRDTTRKQRVTSARGPTKAKALSGDTSRRPRTHPREARLRNLVKHQTARRDTCAAPGYTSALESIVGRQLRALPKSESSGRRSTSIRFTLDRQTAGCRSINGHFWKRWRRSRRHLRSACLGASPCNSQHLLLPNSLVVSRHVRPSPARATQRLQSL